jgi:TPR repeat protein
MMSCSSHALVTLSESEAKEIIFALKKICFKKPKKDLLVKDQYANGMHYLYVAKPRDIKRAFTCFAFSAANNYADAQYEMAKLCELAGQIDKAATFHYLAATQGHTDSNKELNKLLHNFLKESEETE